MCSLRSQRESKVEGAWRFLRYDGYSASGHCSSSIRIVAVAFGVTERKGAFLKFL